MLTGYGDNVFVSMKELNERKHRFVRYKDTDDIDKLDLQSSSARPISEAPVSIVLANDIRYSTAVRNVAIIPFVGELKPSWVKYILQRKIDLTNEEENHLRQKNIFSKIQSVLSNTRTITLDDVAGTVFNEELKIRKEMVTSVNF